MSKIYTLKGKGKVAWRDEKGLHIVRPGTELTGAELKKLPPVVQKKFVEVEQTEQVQATPEQPVRSMEMKADEAIKHIEDAAPEKLTGFLSDHEERVTVQRAWDEKFQEEPN